MNRKVIFFFPYWCYGGGERVHADILKVFSNYNTTCFISEVSPNNGFKQDFVSNSNVVDISDWRTTKKSASIILQNIARAINNEPDIILFGCNSQFYYDLIPLLNTDVKIIDLIHAFSGPKGSEYYSLPYVHRFYKRIVLGEKTKNDFKKLYEENEIPSKFLENLTIIPNKVDAPEAIPFKNYSGKLNILFVARNSDEKRPELFLRITELASDLELPVNFLIIGDFEGIRGRVNQNTTVVGEITDRELLNNHYLDSHLILITSNREGFPMVLLEGMSYGVVPISTAVGEIPYYLSKENRIGYLIEHLVDIEISANMFVNQIKFLLQNREEMASFSLSGYNFVKLKFSKEAFYHSYQKAFFS